MLFSRARFIFFPFQINCVKREVERESSRKKVLLMFSFVRRRMNKNTKLFVFIFDRSRAEDTLGDVRTIFKRSITVPFWLEISERDPFPGGCK